MSDKLTAKMIHQVIREAQKHRIEPIHRNGKDWYIFLTPTGKRREKWLAYLLPRTWKRWTYEQQLNAIGAFYPVGRGR